MNPQEAKKLEKEVLTTLKKHLKKGSTIVVGVSGGADSIFLLHFLSQLPIKIIVSHINHQLRKEESDKDENFVKKHVEKLNDIPNLTELYFYSKKEDIKYQSRKSKTGIEETGRKIRYTFFKKLATKNNAKFIITAHHADDNLETILLNFTRGASLQGLTGMKVIENNLFRPLLNISKKQINEYLKLKKIPYRTDKSNNDTTYKRNFIRHKITPELKQANPNITQTTAKNTKNLREIEDFLNQEAKRWINSQEPQSLDAKSFRNLHPALQKTILRQIHKNLTGNTKNLETTHLNEALKIISSNIGNKKKKMGKLIISIQNNTISIEK